MCEKTGNRENTRPRVRMGPVDRRGECAVTTECLAGAPFDLAAKADLISAILLLKDEFSASDPDVVAILL